MLPFVRIVSILMNTGSQGSEETPATGESSTPQPGQVGRSGWVEHTWSTFIERAEVSLIYSEVMKNVLNLTSDIARMMTRKCC